MAMNRHDRAEFANEMKKKKIEVDESLFYRLMKSHIELKALHRHGVETWEGFGTHRDGDYDEECISKVPDEFLD